MCGVKFKFLTDWKNFKLYMSVLYLVKNCTHAYTGVQLQSNSFT